MKVEKGKKAIEKRKLHKKSMLLLKELAMMNSMITTHLNMKRKSKLRRQLAWGLSSN